MKGCDQLIDWTKTANLTKINSWPEIHGPIESPMWVAIWYKRKYLYVGGIPRLTSQFFIVKFVPTQILRGPKRTIILCSFTISPTELKDYMILKKTLPCELWWITSTAWVSHIVRRVPHSLIWQNSFYDAEEVSVCSSTIRKNVGNFSYNFQIYQKIQYIQNVSICIFIKWSPIWSLDCSVIKYNYGSTLQRHHQHCQICKPAKSLKTRLINSKSLLREFTQNKNNV